MFYLVFSAGDIMILLLNPDQLAGIVSSHRANGTLLFFIPVKDPIEAASVLMPQYR